MLYLIIFLPIVAALVILLGAPARQTALIGSLLLLALTMWAFAMFDRDTGAIPVCQLNTYPARLEA